MKIPKKIQKCPIVDSVVEIRFETDLFSSAVFGVIYTELKEKYKTVEKLPILQLPDQVRDADPAFAFKAHYKITDGKYSILIGPNVIVMGALMPYEGWDIYSSRIFDCLDKIFKLGFITKVERLGIRVINLFEENIFDMINLKIDLADSKYKLFDTVFRTIIEKDGYSNTLQIASDVSQELNGKVIVGSMIDIDTYKTYNDKSFIKKFKVEINKAHDIEKEMFYSLLKETYIKKLMPKYE